MAPLGPATPAAKPLVAVSTRCFIETQFPIAKLSQESYRERTAKQSQTLTGLGKWWGRKPLVLVRATILGLLLPTTDDPRRDREIFLKLMAMDPEGLRRRKSKPIPLAECFSRVPKSRQREFFEAATAGKKLTVRKGLSAEKKAELQDLAFDSMSYNEKLDYSCRIEHSAGPSESEWAEINGHLDTHASNLPDLVAELGQRQFGHVPRVGDAFCGGGSIPFEAARIGCDAYASDLNPVAALLTWSGLNVIGGGAKVAAEVQAAQKAVYERVDKQVTAWGIEHDAKGNRADAFLYCIDATCPECGWRVPLAPSWIVGEGTRTIVKLLPDAKRKRFDFEIRSGVSEAALVAARAAGTAKDGALVCSSCEQSTPLRAVRGDGRTGLRDWENSDLIPRSGDVFGERLYCVRWVETTEKRSGDVEVCRRYRAPSAEDLAREERVLELLCDRFVDWQARGFVPKRRIQGGSETSRPSRERGWTHWHHLFNPRQLLLHGLAAEATEALRMSLPARVGMLQTIGRCADWNSRLSRWHPNGANEKSEQTFSNQALNTLANYGTRSLVSLETTWFSRIADAPVVGCPRVEVCDARGIEQACDMWITDPPYADAVSYEELSEFFLAWYEGGIPRLLPDWYTDSKRALAVKGETESFRPAMVECYRNLAQRMPDNGLQVVMFTHQDAAVWADLALILWAAGLRVTAAWCIATEIDSALKEGNYVQGTVLLILRKQTSREEVFLDEVTMEVEAEVRRQLDTMRDLDDSTDPNFGDTDYQLAAYAAALRVLTSRPVDGIDVAHELKRVRAKGEKSPVEELIENAVRIACDHLVPRGIETHLWKALTGEERLYLKGLEMESHGERRSGVYQELARGFGIGEYKNLLASDKANQTRLRTAKEFARKDLGTAGFGSSLLRQALFAVFKTTETESTKEGMRWLRDELKDYWNSRERLTAVLEYLASLQKNASMDHWHADADSATLLAGAVRNDHV